MTKILAISDVHGEENPKLYDYLENNDIDLVLILGDITDFGPLDFVETFINSSDAVIVGIFDSEEKYLYGLVIFDNIRFANKSSAQVHIVNDKSIFGRKVRGLYEDILATCMFDTLYAEIPSMAVHAIALCKRLGFKKTGYIPDILPYVNCSGEEKMYDIQIWTWRRANAKV